MDPEPTPDATPTEAPVRPTAGRVETLALALAVASGLAVWGIGIVNCGYDYDEVQRAHSVWLSAQGQRPYRDFFECHPPYFALLTPVVRTFRDPCDALRALRVVAATGNLLFLAGLAALAASALAVGWRWAVLGVAAVAFHPAVVGFLLEFRIDGWGYAIAVWSFWRFIHSPRGLSRGFEFGTLTGIATLLFCPKLALLPSLVVAFDLLATCRSPRVALRTAAGYGVGVMAAAAFFALYLAWHRIDFSSTSQLLGRYHAVSNANSSARYGLLWSLRENRWLLALVAAGAAVRAAQHVYRRTWPTPYEAALAIWLVAQAFLVAYPYKQYYAPWFLFASGFAAAFGGGLAALPRRAGTAGFLVACALILVGDCQTGRAWVANPEARSQEQLIRWMNRVARPEDRVVGCLPVHPIARHDTFFLWFNTADVGGFNSERILARLPSYRRYVAPETYLEELIAHPPALVAISGDWRIVEYTKAQSNAIKAFLGPYGYRKVAIGHATFAVRPDRLEQARRAGLLKPNVLRHPIAND